MISCGSRDLTRADGAEATPDPLNGLEPDRFFLLSKNTNFIDVALRQVSSDFSSVFFTDITINLLSSRVSFENESVGELDCQLDAGVNNCSLIFYEGITGPFAIGFQDSYNLRISFQNTEGFLFDNAPAVFASDICDSNFGSSIVGEKISMKVLDKDSDEVLVSLFYHEFGFENQGQLSPPQDSENTSLHYGLNFDALFAGPYSFSGLRKNTSDEISYLEIQAVQTTPVFKRSLVCFND